MAKGHKTGGRQKGTHNKVTKEIRDLLKDILAKELGEVDKQLELLEPKDRLDFITKLLPYAMPKYVNQAYEEEDEAEIKKNAWAEQVNQAIKEVNQNYKKANAL